MVYATTFYSDRTQKVNIGGADRIFFSAWDHVMFVLIISLATIVGFYYGYLRKFIRDKLKPIDTPTDGVARESDGETMNYGSPKMFDYLLASKKMSPFPVALSLTAYYISGVTIVGFPTEVYYFGTQIWLMVVGTILSAITVVKVYLPVFCALRVGTSYEYLEMRFSSTVRSIASILYVLDALIFLPFVMYAPALAYSQATGVNILVITFVGCVFCTIYTVIGGIRAVVHTNVWQCFVMYTSTFFLVIYGWSLTSDTVMDNAYRGRRLVIFNFNPSLYERSTVWSTIIGNFFYFTSYNSVNQSVVQRYMSLPSYEKCERSIIFYITSVVLIMVLSILSGLLVYDAFHDCDPKSAGYIEFDDQLLPLYMMRISSNMETLGGLLIAGLFCAGLSTLSGMLNTIALVIMEDLIKGTFGMTLSEKTLPIVLHSTIVILGCITMFLVFLLDQFEGIFGDTYVFTSIASSVTFGIFTLGMLVPWTNSKGAIAGGFVGLLLTGWIAIGQFVNKSSNAATLALSVSGCPHNVTIAQYRNRDNLFPLYRISYFWINVFGVLSTMLVGVVVSFLTKPMLVRTLDATLMSPVIHRYLPIECWRRGARSYDYS